MQPGDQQKSTPPRGTIIVDTSALLRMWGPISLGHQASNRLNPKRTYLELLQSLARDGFHVVIPEIVAVETAQVLRDGTNIGSYFPKSSHEPSDEILVPFLQKVAQGKMPNMVIEKPEEKSPSLQHIAELRHAVSIADIGKARAAIKSLQRAGNEHLGDQEITSLIEHSENPERIFVLTNDVKLKQDVKHKKARTLSPQKLVYCVAGNGLLNRMGLNACSSAAAICTDMYTATIDPGDRDDNLGLQPTVSEESVKKLGFYDALAELARDKNIGAAATSVGETAPGDNRPTPWEGRPGMKPPARGGDDGSGTKEPLRR